MGEMVARALRPVKLRTATNPTRASRERRIKEKRHRGEIKKARRRPGTED
jgi:ribosome-associated protein